MDGIGKQAPCARGQPSSGQERLMGVLSMGAVLHGDGNAFSRPHVRSPFDVDLCCLFRPERDRSNKTL